MTQTAHSAKQTVLVTGGAGFIGSNFIRYFLRRNPLSIVINVDKLTYAGNPENLKDIEENENYHFFRADICDKAVLRGIFDKYMPDVVINFAAESHVDRSIIEPEEFLKTNIYGTYSLLEIAREKGIGLFLQVSTDEVYGSIESGSFREDSPLSPNSPYAASKAGADMLVRAYNKTYGFPAIITRCANNYGPYQFPEKLIPLVIINALNGKLVPIYGDGKNRRDWIYVADHCSAIELIFKKGVPGEIYNIDSGEERENIEVVKMILKEVSERIGKDVISLINFVKDRPGHDRRYSMDSSKLRAMGWSPSYFFEYGIRQTIDWYMENRQWWQRIISGEYMQYYERQYGAR